MLGQQLTYCRQAACKSITENKIMLIERFSFECRKVIGFAFTTLRDLLKRFAPYFHPIRSKTKTNFVIASRASATVYM